MNTQSSTFYHVRWIDGLWSVIAITTSLQESVQLVRDCFSEAHFINLLDASDYAENLRQRDGQPSHVVLS